MEKSEAFLSNLAVLKKLAASTQRQTLNAIVFLYKRVLDIPVDDKLEPVKAKKHRRPPVVMSQNEVTSVLNQLQGKHLLMAKNIDAVTSPLDAIPLPE